MNKKPIKLRAKLKDNITIVKALMSHPMETGFRKSKVSGKLIPAHFIQEITCKHNGEVKVMMELGVSSSMNPYLLFELEDGKKGDILELSWKDNLGETDSITTAIR